MAHLGRLRSLQAIKIDETAVSDAGLAQLGDLPDLRFLYVNDTNVTRVGIVSLLCRARGLQVYTR